MPVVVQRQVLMVQVTSFLSPFSALSLVRQRIHALRQSVELLEEFLALGGLSEMTSCWSPYSAQCSVRQRILAHASDNAGFASSDCR